MEVKKRRIIFVGGFPATMTKQTLEAHFAKYGEVSKVKIMRVKKTKVDKCHAFVAMKNSDLLPVIIKDLQIIDGRKLDCQIASRNGEKKERKEDQKKRRIFATNLSDEHASEQLCEGFSQFGELRTANVIYDYFTKLTKNYGYFEFRDPEAAKEALNSEVILKGSRVLRVPFVSKHEKKKRNSSEEDEIEQDSFIKLPASSEVQSGSEKPPSTNDLHYRFPEQTDLRVSPNTHIQKEQKRTKISFHLAKALQSSKQISESISNYRVNLCCSFGDGSRPSQLDFAAWFRITQHGSQKHDSVLNKVSPIAIFPQEASLFKNSQEIQGKTTDSNGEALEDPFNCSPGAPL